MKFPVIPASLAALALLGCTNAPRPGNSQPAQPATYQPAIIDRAPSDNRYDQPGELPANSGGTDAGRIGTDQRYEPVR